MGEIQQVKERDFRRKDRIEESDGIGKNKKKKKLRKKKGKRKGKRERKKKIGEKVRRK